MGTISHAKVHPEPTTNHSKNQSDYLVNKFRTNGWTAPLHPLQIMAFLCFFFLAGKCTNFTRILQAICFFISKKSSFQLFAKIYPKLIRIFFINKIAGHLGLMVPFIPNATWRWSIIFLSALAFIINFIILIINISIDPADINVINKYKCADFSRVGLFNPNRHRHVIENQFCYICCLLYTSPSPRDS